MTNTWINLAWKEFWLPFFHWRKESCPGGRDFLWLSVFLSLLLTLSLMMFASSEGVLNRFVDVLLGKQPEHGVPVWITPNILSRSGIDLIDTQVLNEIEELGFKVSPYREIEVGFDTYVDLPNESAWGRITNIDGVSNTTSGNSALGVEEFNGWAVYQDDPLWSAPKQNQKSLLTIVLNKTLFSRNFNYAAYLDGLSGQLSSHILSALPETLESSDIASLKTLWLKLKIGGHDELTPFDIVWVDYIHAIDKVSFLFPLTTYHALQMAHRYPALKYFPEADGQDTMRVKAISVEENPSSQDVQSFAIAINGEVTDFRGDVNIDFGKFIPDSFVKAYALEHGIKYQIIESVVGDEITHAANTIVLPCGRLPDDQIAVIGGTSLCRADARHPISLNVTDKGYGFRRAIVYIPDRTQLFTAVEKLLKVKDGAVSIHPVYQDALNKFAFLTRMIESMRQPFGFVLLISLIALVGIQLFTLIGHRRHRYGMFLSKGFEWWQIYLMMLFQITLALSLGTVAAVTAIHLVRTYLEQAIRVVAIEYRETLSLVDLNLMPLSVGEYVGVSFSVLALSCLLAAQVLYFMPLRQRTQPAILFQQ